ncbi:MAG: YtxH domain-containing protein [Cytophagales bacterium]|nr:YtxH domain-containing protein [Cytophagales bacterium]
MSRNTWTFLTGVAVGIAAAMWIGSEDRKKLQKKLSEQAKKLCEEYEGPIKEKASKIKKFVKGQLS